MREWRTAARPASRTGTISLEEAECDNCGGEMQATAPDLPSPACNGYCDGGSCAAGRAGDD